MASQLSLSTSNKYSRLNPNAKPFYYVPPCRQFLPKHHHLLYDAFLPSSPFYTTVERPTHVPVGTQTQCRISVSTNRNMQYCHQKFRMRYGESRVRYEWRVKGTHEKPAQNGCAPARGNGNGNGIPFPTTIDEAQTSNTTTLMIRNIPNQMKFSDLLQILDEHCLQQNESTDGPADYSKFDFLYLPMDYRKHAIEKRLSNLGYAFVNFTTPTAAFKFYQRFHGFVWNVTENRKTCEINPARYQGKEALIRIFQEKIFRCKSREFLPCVYLEARDGFNRNIDGTIVGKYVWGLPQKSTRS